MMRRRLSIARPRAGAAQYRLLHGHVQPRPDGQRAACGGPSVCATCRAEWFIVHRSIHPDTPRRPA